VILDSSALVAIFVREPGFERILDAIDDERKLAIGAPTLAEAGIVLSARLGTDARPLLARFLEESGALVLPFSAEHAREAIGAFRRFGKGRHRAALNFGDCMTYATARLADEPLLCTGNDFRKTDLTVAQA
jgi:ribonuclease VapC